MTPLRIKQRKNEMPGIFAMRAFAIAMPRMSYNELAAAAQWIAAIVAATIKGKRS